MSREKSEGAQGLGVWSLGPPGGARLVRCVQGAVLHGCEMALLFHLHPSLDPEGCRVLMFAELPLAAALRSPVPGLSSSSSLLWACPVASPDA